MHASVISLVKVAQEVSRDVGARRRRRSFQLANTIMCACKRDFIGEGDTRGQQGCGRTQEKTQLAVG